jgi:hypothetical protein
MDRKLKRVTWLIVVLCCATIPTQAAAQIVGDVTGEIDLRLYPFFDTKPVWSEQEGKNIWVPDEGEHEVFPVGLSDVSVSIDGSGSYSSKGLSAFDYGYTRVGKSEALFNFHAFADSLDAGDGAGGKAALDMQITFDYPVYYRFEADVIDAPVLYRVSFNGQEAEAWYSAMGIYGGSFPPTYHYDNPMPDGWDTYVDEGTLPAGTYQLSVAAYASLHRYGIGIGSEGTASLRIQLLGDANLNGRVGVEDLNMVLNHWGMTLPQSAASPGDLDGDGLVGIGDLNMVLAGWNADVRSPGQPVVPVPEPTTGWVLVVVGLALTRRGLRKRP